jgi:esterase/lipase superfamily enzyme
LTAGVGKAQGLESVVQGLLNGPRAAVARFLNLLTYYEMKSRAGIVGVGLADNVLSKLAAVKKIQLHLVGHSFGARLVTAAANRVKAASNIEFYSLTLLQGAFSHNGFAKVVTPGVAGAFPDLVGKPTGPMVITHTHNDLACTLLYAIASRLSRDITKSIGDAQDEFGAMGANGPQKLDVNVLEPDDTAQIFQPKRRKVNTFLADAFIVKTNQIDAHNNVTNSQCGRLLAATIMS